MNHFSLRAKQTASDYFNGNNTSINLGALFFCVLSLLVGYSISSSITYTILIVAALLGVVICLKPEIGLYVIVFLIPFEAISGVAESITALKLVGWVILAGWLLNIALTKKAIIFPHEGWYLVGFVAWGLISAFWAVDPTIVIQRIPTLIQLLGFYVLVVNLVDSKGRIHRLLWVLIIGCVIGTGLVFFYFREAYILESSETMRIGIGNPNVFSVILLLVLPFLFLSIINAKSNIIRLTLLVITSGLFFAFFIGMSRGAILGLLVIIGAILVGYRSHMPRLIFFVTIVIFAGLYFMPEQFWVRMVSGFTFEDRGEGRFDIWLVAWTMIKENPLLGVGLSNFKSVFMSYQAVTPDLMNRFSYARAPHNIYIGTVTELGILGGALLFMLVASHLRSGLKAVGFFEREHDQSGQIIAFSLMASFLALLVISLKADILTTKYFLIWLGLIGSMSLVTRDTAPN